MAANYYDSTQAKFWTFTRQELEEIRAEQARTNAAVQKKHPLPDPRHMSIYMQAQLLKLGKPMNLRQQALATAQIYIKRFYLRAEIRKTNPYLIMATAVYLACKMEECPQHIRLILGETARRWPELAVNETSKIGECEFAMISTLNSRLILHHPYRALTDLHEAIGLTAEEVSLAHSVINDSYNTDLPLLYAPTTIAVAAMFLAVILKPATYQQPTSGSSTPAMTANTAQSALTGIVKPQPPGKLNKMITWLAESKISMESIIDATQEMISLYDVWETSYNEKACKEAISRWMKEVAR